MKVTPLLKRAKEVIRTPKDEIRTLRKQWFEATQEAASTRRQLEVMTKAWSHSHRRETIMIRSKYFTTTSQLIMLSKAYKVQNIHLLIMLSKAQKVHTGLQHYYESYMYWFTTIRNFECHFLGIVNVTF